MVLFEVFDVDNPVSRELGKEIVCSDNRGQGATQRYLAVALLVAQEPRKKKERSIVFQEDPITPPEGIRELSKAALIMLIHYTNEYAESEACFFLECRC